MKELYEFRTSDRKARRFFSESEGKVSWGARIFSTRPGHHLYQRIALVERTLRAEGNAVGLIHSWSCQRTYSRAELASADWFTVSVIRGFEPTGEELGTVYDSSRACELCGFGDRRISPLQLDFARVPRSVDIARSIAGEIVVSERFAEVLVAEKLEGLQLEPAVAHRSTKRAVKHWFAASPREAALEIAAPPTRLGVDPFDEDERGEYRCPRGHVAGLRLLTELTVSRSSLGTTDVQATRVALGRREGLLRPERIWVVGRRFRDAYLRARLKGLDFEIARSAD